AAMDGPPIHSEAGDQHLQRYPKIRRTVDRHDHVQPIQWIELPGLESREERHAAVVVRVPKHEVSTPQLVEGKLPKKEGARLILVGRGIHTSIAGNQHVPENSERRNDE